MRIVPPSVAIPKYFSFRPANLDDTQDIKDLIYTVLIEYGLKPEPNGVDQDLENIETSYKDGYFGVIENGNKVVATYGLIPLNHHSAEIRKMYALPIIRGKGLGKWMVQHLIEIAKHNGFIEVELETASPLVEAIGLYQRLGFVEKNFENKTPRCDKSFYLKI